MGASVIPPNGKAVSEDGTAIAYWRSGDGPPSARPLVLVHGTTSDHQTFDELLPHAAARRTVYVYDRRGRGESGDESVTSGYSIDRESVDAAAIFDEVARRENSDVDVLSHSFGAFAALGALPRTKHVHGLAVYSPGFGAAYPPGALDQVDAAIASGDPDTALQVICRDLVGMPDEQIAVLRNSPVWAVRKELAWTVPRECRADASFLDDYLPLLASLDSSVLVINGETNTPDKQGIAARLSDVIPNAARTDLAGEGHAAHHTAPRALLDAALQYFDQLAPVR